MVRYILASLSILLAVSEFNFGNPAGATPSGRVVASLGYAFSPLLLAVIVAGTKGLIQNMRGTPTRFHPDLNWVWAILLVLLAATHSIDLMMT